MEAEKQIKNLISGFDRRKKAEQVRKLYTDFPFPNEQFSIEELNVHSWILNCLPKSIILGSKILDVGCGTGDISCFFSRYGNVTGIDFSEKSIEIAKKYADNLKIKNVKFLVDDLTNLKHNKKYDYIFAIGVLHHIPKMNKAIENLNRLLKDNGQLIISVYNRYGWFWHKFFQNYFKKKISKTRIMDGYYHPYEVRYSRKEFEKILRNHNLKILKFYRNVPEWLRFITGRGITMNFCVVK